MSFGKGKDKEDRKTVCVMSLIVFFIRKSQL